MKIRFGRYQKFVLKMSNKSIVVTQTFENNIASGQSLEMCGTGTKRKILAGPEPGPGPNKKSYRDQKTWSRTSLVDGKLIPILVPAGPAPKFFLNRTGTKICFWTGTVTEIFSTGTGTKIFFSPEPGRNFFSHRDQKLLVPVMSTSGQLS